MKWLKRIMIVVGVLLVAIVGLGVIGYFAGPKGSSGSGLTITLKTGGKKVIAAAQETVNQKGEGDAVTVTLDKKHVVVVRPDTITVNGEAQPFTAKVVRITSLKDGTLTIDPSSE